MCYVSVRHAIRKLRMPTLCSESTECIWFIIACEYSFLGTMRKSSIKMYFFYFKAISHVMGYHDGTQNFTIRKYDILAFKWRVLSIFSIPGSKVIPKNKRTLVKCPGLYYGYLKNCCSTWNAMHVAVLRGWIWSLDDFR